jgi:hypothetical protein
MLMKMILLKTKQLGKMKKKMKEYQDTFNIMNKNRNQVTQDSNETDVVSNLSIFVNHRLFCF